METLEIKLVGLTFENNESINEWIAALYFKHVFPYGCRFYLEQLGRNGVVNGSPDKIGFIRSILDVEGINYI